MSASAVTNNSTSGSSSTSSSTNSSSKSSSTTTLGKDAFLQLLVTQMKNQDPLSPTDNTQYIAELAQFSSLEQMQNLNTTTSTISQEQRVLEGSSLVGKTVTATNTSTSETVTGTVSNVKFSSSGATVCVNGTDYSLSNVSLVK